MDATNPSYSSLPSWMLLNTPLFQIYILQALLPLSDAALRSPLRNHHTHTLSSFCSS